jgi:tetratricopeptide (TPR) repeat protein
MMFRRQKGSEMCRKQIGVMTLIFFVLFNLSLWSCASSSQRQGWIKGLDPEETNPKVAKNFFRSLRPTGGNPESHYRLACYYQERGDHREALEEFKKVVLIDPGNAKAYSGMGVSYDQLRDFVRAMECYERALALNPDLETAQNNLGYSYLLQGKPEEAVSAFKKAIARNNGDSRYHNNLGLAYAAQGRLDLALEEFKLAGDESKAHYNVARFYQERGLYHLAHVHFSVALRLDPSFTHARLALEAIEGLARIFKTPLPIESQETRPSDLPPRNEKEPIGKDPLNVSDLPVVPVVKRPAPQAEVEVAPSPEAEAALAVPGATRGGKAKAEPEEATLRKESAPDESPPDGTAPPLSSSPPSREPESPSKSPRSNKEVSSSSLHGVNVEVSNGNGVNGMARKIGRYLRAKGLEVTRITNAEHFNHQDSKIYYQRGYQGAASHLADQLPSIQDVEESRPFDRPQIKVKVLIGKDLAQHQKSFTREK